MLEKRQLLTTLTGGGGSGTSLNTAIYEFLDGDGNTMRIAMRGNMTAEFIGLWVADSDNVAPLRPTTNVFTDLIRRNQQNPFAMPGTFLPGAYLYSIYIASADMDASMSIAMVAPTGDVRPMRPFSGASQSFNIINSRTGEREDVNPAGQSGALLIGARTGNTIEGTDDEENIAIGSQVLKRDFGVRPRTPKGKIDAGISTAPGVNIGQILFGGTITGRVSIGGSINLFYAGQIWTGDATGIPDFSAPNVPRNFEVGGDLRALVTIGSIGTDAIDDSRLEEVDFKTGFDLRVRGRLGQIMTKDSFLGAVTVTNDQTFFGPGTPIREVEVQGVPKRDSESFFEGNDFSLDPRQAEGSLGDNPIFNNDTLATAEYVGTARSSNFGGRVLAEIVGRLNGDDRVNDDADFYAMGILAGQTVEVQLTGASMNVGVYDPDGRIIASDYSNNDFASVIGAPFRFTATMPGIYKFAVGNAGDINFNERLDAEESISSISGPNPYTLRIDRVADVALGAIAATHNIGTTDSLDPSDFFAGSFPSIVVENGDLGALVSTASDNSSGNAIFSTGSPYTVTRGNLRVIESDSIGILRNNEPVAWPDLRVPKGTVGLLRARGTDVTSEVLSVNLTFVTPFAGTYNPVNSIGYDYQLVDAGAVFAGNLLADRGIGIVRADRISTTGFAPRLAANADNIGNDGFIDLIDARTSLGTLEAGGPEITTGTGGNVKYIRSQGATFRDRFFGGGTSDFTRLSPGVPFRYTDDSGTAVKITPLPIITAGQDNFAAVGLTVQTYGIRDKGGSVLTFIAINGVRSTDTIAELQTGILIDTGNTTVGGGAEIGRIVMNNTGAPITFVTQITDANGNLVAARQFNTDRSTTQDQTLEMKGRKPVSVFEVVGTNINTLDNRTSGDIVNVTAQSVGLLQGNNIGVAMSATKTVLQGVDVIRDVFPFKKQRTLINVNGAIQTIRARGAVGNVFSNTTIGEVSANSDGADQKGVLEGITAPISATNSILNVNIGEMLTPSGSGDFAQSGIFAGGVIASIRNQGINSDIRGDIVASQNSVLPAVGALKAVAGIGEILLENGSIIDADIMVARLTDSLELTRPFIFPGSTDFFFPASVPNIGRIALEGNGGIIGSIIGGDSLEFITIKSGFGLINSRIIQNASGSFDGIDTDGYGIRLSRMDGGSTIRHIIARGSGKIIDTRSYSITVRQSESLSFDPYSGRLLTRENDLHKFLGTTGSNPKNNETSVSGTIEDSTITGSRDLEELSAFRITGRPEVLDPLTLRPAMRMSFAQNIGKFLVAENINGLDLTAGRITLLQAGRDFLNTTVSVSGLLKSLVAGNNIKASTTIDVQGGEGRIESISTKRALFGRISAATRIDSITIGTDLGSPSLSSSNDIGIVTIKGNILAGATLRAADQIETLIINGNINTGGTVRAKRIGSQQIDGSVSGDIVIG